MSAGLILAAASYFGGAQISGVTFGPDGAHAPDTESRTLSQEFPDGFQSVDLDMESGNVTLIPSDRFGVQIQSGVNDSFTCSAEGGTLKITGSKQSRTVWMNFDFGPRKRDTVQIRIPKGTALKNLKLRVRDGDADLSGFSAENTDIQNQYGALRLSGASCGAASIVLENGSATMKNLKTETLNYTNDYGDSSLENVSVSSLQEAIVCARSGTVTARNFSASDVSVNNEYGDVWMSGLKLSRLACTMKNGNLNLSDSTVGSAVLNNSYGGIQASGLNSGGLTIYGKNGNIRLSGTLKGKNYIHSAYGNIGIQTLFPQNRYTLELSTNYGSVTVNGQKLSGSLLQTGTSENLLTASAKNGNVSVDFGK